MTFTQEEKEALLTALEDAEDLLDQPYSHLPDINVRDYLIRLMDNQYQEVLMDFKDHPGDLVILFQALQKEGDDMVQSYIQELKGNIMNQVRKVNQSKAVWDRNQEMLENSRIVNVFVKPIGDFPLEELTDLYGCSSSDCVYSMKLKNITDLEHIYKLKQQNKIYIDYSNPRFNLEVPPPSHLKRNFSKYAQVFQKYNNWQGPEKIIEALVRHLSMAPMA